jgi:hypothetical protein
VSELLQLSRDLQEQCRFPNAGLSTDENHRARDDAPAEYEIEFLDARFEATAFGALDVAQSRRRRDTTALRHGLLTGDTSPGRRR